MRMERARLITLSSWPARLAWDRSPPASRRRRRRRTRTAGHARLTGGPSRSHRHLPHPRPQATTVTLTGDWLATPASSTGGTLPMTKDAERRLERHDRAARADGAPVFLHRRRP